MKVLFIVSDTGYYRSGLSNPLGVLSIATYLKKTDMMSRCTIGMLTEQNWARS